MIVQAAEIAVNEFGRCPRQIFTSPHPPRLVCPTPAQATAIAASASGGLAYVLETKSGGGGWWGVCGGGGGGRLNDSYSQVPSQTCQKESIGSEGAKRWECEKVIDTYCEHSRDQ